MSYLTEEQEAQLARAREYRMTDQEVENAAQEVLEYVLSRDDDDQGDAITAVTGLNWEDDSGRWLNRDYARIKRRFCALMEQHKWPDGKRSRGDEKYDHMYQSVIPDLPKADIIEDYTEKQASLHKLAEKYGRARSTIRKALVQWGIEIDSKRRVKRSMKNVPSPYHDVQIRKRP